MLCRGSLLIKYKKKVDCFGIYLIDLAIRRKTIKKGAKEGRISGSLTYGTPTGLNSYIVYGMEWNGKD